MEKKITAHVIALIYPGHQRHEIYDVEMDVSTQDQTAMFLRVGATGRKVLNYLLEMDAPDGKVSIGIGPDHDGLCGLVQDALRCHIPAQFDAQAWIDDYAVSIDDGLTEFNALPALAKMQLGDVQAMFAEASDFDSLADDLQERIDHNGPFEVRIDEQDVLRMVCLLSSAHGALGQGDSMQDVKPLMWDDFCLVARGILAAKEQVNSTQRDAQSRQLTIDGNTFDFKGEPGKSCAVDTTWANPFSDDAYQLALTLMESQILALYSAGVLWSDGAFNPKVVEALQTSFDAIPRLVEALDESDPFVENDQRAVHERPR